MVTKEITILGYSDAYITMIFDMFIDKKVKFKILDNFKLFDKKRIHNQNINYEIISEFEECDNFLYGSAKTSTRKKLIETFNIDKNKLYTIISDRSFISNTVDVGKGCVINPICSIAGNTVISDNVYINRSVSIGHHTFIGENTSINPGVNISGNVSIGKNCQIGIGATIIDNVIIGDNVIVGAGSVVTKSIPDNVVAYGNPCKIIRENKD
jgi:sugar O-acyltransferase (sialic acid O-acetyltransferase NeuD family)